MWLFLLRNNKTWVMTCDNETTEPQGEKKTRLPPLHFISVKPKNVLPLNTFNSRPEKPVCGMIVGGDCIFA